MTDAAKEMLALADEIERIGLREFVARRKHIEFLAGKRIVAALRSAASAPSQAGEIERKTIERCAKVLDDAAQDWRRIRDPGMANNAASYAKQIRALSVTGEARANSAPGFKASQNTAERDPSVTPDCPGAEAIVAGGVREALEKIVAEWDKCNEQELQLDEGVEQAIEAGRAALSALPAPEPQRGTEG
jgi:hypothetical protein